jgi:hypothetical protein
MKHIAFVMIVLFVAALSGSAQKLEFLWTSDTLLRVPESVYFSAGENILYVANIDGKSNEKDGKGFISKLTLQGKIQALRWVEGLDAPKGMGLYNGKLYVADLTRVAVINIATAKILSLIEIPGAQFLNDITVSAEGRIYVSDSVTGRIFELTNDNPLLYFEGKQFKRLNGLLALKDGLYVADAGTGINYKLSDKKELTKYAETAQGADGIVQLSRNDYIVSSWGGEIYYVDKNGDSKKLLDTKEQKLNSADIAYNPETRTLYVPTFFGNSVMAYQFSD